MGSKRRYKIGVNPIYDRNFNRFRLESRILNAGGKRTNVYSVCLQDKTELMSLLREYVGSDEGGKCYYPDKDPQWQTALIPALNLKLKQIDNEFKAYQQSKVNLGYEVPTQMPADLVQKQLIAQARLDVTEEELEDIEARLKVISEQKVILDDSEVLKYGLVQMGKGDPLREIDGQKVSILKGLAVIDDERSPYDGMLVSDYRKLANEWRKEREEMARQKYQKAVEQAKSLGHERPEEPINLPKNISKSKLPPYPKGVKNFKQESAIV